MFRPIRGEWGDSDWRGWWGDEPPYHCPVYVLTHYPHDPIELTGGTTFHFVTDGIEAAYAEATQAAGGRSISIAGGASVGRRRFATSIRGVKRASLLVVGSVLAMGAVPQAHADDDDTAYLAAIQSVGVPANSPAAATAYGRGLCQRITGTTFDTLVGAVHQDNLAAGVTMHQSALITGAAISNYCIDNVARLPKTLDY